MNTAYLLTGGNMGEREMYLQQAIKLVEECAGRVQTLSSIYETAPWGKTDQPAFLNQVLCIETILNPEDLLIVLLDIERKIGRQRHEKMGPRIIDIDILFYNNLVLETENLIIPHPQIAFRRFVLTPIMEIAPGFVHPVLKKSITTLLENCPDTLPVSKHLATTQ